MKESKRSIVGHGFAVVAVAACIAGCMSLPSVGPNYEHPESKDVEFALPDAGQPTTNLTDTAE